MPADAIDAFFHPRAVVLVGASTRPRSVGGIVARNLIAGARDRLLLVNPKGGEIDGLPLYPNVAGLPVKPDLGIVTVPPGAVLEVLADLGRAGRGRRW